MSPSPTRLRVFATLWSLRQYPTKETEWSWARKFEAINAARFDGIMSPPIPELSGRGPLAYWAISSVGVGDDPRPFFEKATALGAEAATIQICDVDTPLADCAKVAIGIQQVAADFKLATAIETHRDTFTETPEQTWALCDGYEKETGRPLPVCFDHSHFAVVRHLKAPYWEAIKGREDILGRATQFHMRPFNGHHCQIPATFDGTRPTPEYEDWLGYVRDLFRFVRAQGHREVIAVPELGNANPAYGLSCFPDVWTDAKVTAGDLRRLWNETASAVAGGAAR